MNSGVDVLCHPASRATEVSATIDRAEVRQVET
jgi:hypothetical protein